MTDSSNKPLDLAALATLTGGAFTVSSAADRTARLRDWLAGQPTLEQLQAVFDEMSHRDKGAAKVLREKGYNIARRTVAKYREQLNIPVARMRKEL